MSDVSSSSSWSCQMKWSLIRQASSTAVCNHCNKSTSHIHSSGTSAWSLESSQPALNRLAFKRLWNLFTSTKTMQLQLCSHLSSTKSLSTSFFQKYATKMCFHKICAIWNMKNHLNLPARRGLQKCRILQIQLHIFSRIKTIKHCAIPLWFVSANHKRSIKHLATE